MPDLYGVVDASGTITKFYVSPDFGAAGSNTKLISDVAKNKAGEYTLRKTVNNSDGYRYKWASPGIVAKTDTEIKAALEWMEQKKERLDTKATKDIADLGENKLHALCVKDTMSRLNSGPGLTAGEITDMQEFDDTRDSIRSQFHVDAEAAGFSRLKNHSSDTNSTTVDVKKPGVFEVDDVVTIVDYDDGKRETGTITDITSITITFETALTNSSKYKKKSSWMFKAIG